MKLVPINMPPGLVRGATPYDTPGRWYDANLIRWRQGVMEPIGGWVQQTATNLPLADRIRRIWRWRDNSNFLRTLVFTNAEVRAYSSSSGYVDVSPADLADMGSAATSPVGYGVGAYGAEAYGTARSAGSELLSVLPPAWSMDNWGEDVIAVSSSDGRLAYYDTTSPTTAMTILGVVDVSTAARASNVTTIVTASAHGLVTGDTVQIAGMTDTSFNTSSATVTVSDSTTFTYANTGSDVGSGAETGTVRNREVPISNRAVTVTDERHVMVIQADGNPRRVAWCSREDYLDWDYDSTTNTAGFIDLEVKTPLVAMAEVRNGTLIFTETEVFNGRYVGQPFVYGFDHLEETRLLGPRTLASDSGVCFWWSRDGFFRSDGSVVQPIPCPIWEYIQSCMCPAASPSLAFASNHGSLPEIWWFFPEAGDTTATRYAIYNWLENWWTFGSLSRTAMGPALGGEKPIMGDNSGNLYTHDTGWLDGTGTRDGTIYAESSVVRIPPAGGNLMEIKQAMIANGMDYDSLRVTFYGKQTPHGTERTFGPYNPRSDGYIDTRVTARDIRIRVEALGDADWNLGEMRLDVGAGAKR